MIKIVVLADIHANLPALEAVLADAGDQPVDGYICAGDMVTGPQPNQVMERLINLDAWMIKGNNEAYVLEYARNTLPTEWWSHRQFGFARHSFRLLDGPTLEAIRRLPTHRVVRWQRQHRCAWCMALRAALTNCSFPIEIQALWSRSWK